MIRSALDQIVNLTPFFYVNYPYWSWPWLETPYRFSQSIVKVLVSRGLLYRTRHGTSDLVYNTWDHDQTICEGNFLRCQTGRIKYPSQGYRNTYLSTSDLVRLSPSLRRNYTPHFPSKPSRSPCLTAIRLVCHGHFDAQ